MGVATGCGCNILEEQKWKKCVNISQGMPASVLNKKGVIK